MKSSYQFDKVILEISQEALDRLESYGDDSFKHIFGDKLRIIEPLAGGNEYIMKIKDLVGTEYEFDWEKWVGYKLGDEIKKNPMKVGKILNKRKTEIEKQLRAHKEETEDNAHYFIKELETKIDTINELLKVTNLHKQIKTIKSSLYIVYSKAPIDVVRMSDFDGLWSCHAPDGSYFKCALADASYGAGVAYLITGHDYDKLIETFGDGVYTEDEIFGDNYRDDAGLTGIHPVARQRLRRVLDDKGNELCVPQNKLYAKGDYQYNDDFKEQTLKWAKEQDVSNFNFDSRLKLVGGEYEDSGYDITTMIQKIWDKDVSYSKRYDDSEFEDEEDEDARWQAEYDEAIRDVRRDVNESTIEEMIVGDVYSNNFDYSFDVDVDLEEMRLIYTYTDEFLDIIPDGKESSIREILEDDYIYGGIVLFNIRNNSGKIYKREGAWVIDLISEIPNPADDDYFDYNGGGDYSFDSDSYYNKCAEEFDDLMASCFDNVETVSDTENKWIALKYTFNKEIYNKLELEYNIDITAFDSEEEGPIGSIPEKFTNFEYSLPNLRYGAKAVNNWGAAYTIDDEQLEPIYDGVLEFLLEFIAFQYGRELSDLIKNNRWFRPKLFLNTSHLDRDFASLYATPSSHMLGDTLLYVYGAQPDNKLKFTFKPDANYMAVLLDTGGGKLYKQFLDMANDIVNRDFDDNLEDYGSAEEYVSKRGSDQISVELKRNGQQEFNFEESVEYHDFVRKYLP